MINKLKLDINLTADADRVGFEKQFTQEAADHKLAPYQCFSDKRVIQIGEKHYQVDYSFVIKEIEGTK